MALCLRHRRLNADQCFKVWQENYTSWSTNHLDSNSKEKHRDNHSFVIPQLLKFS